LRIFHRAFSTGICTPRLLMRLAYFLPPDLHSHFNYGNIQVFLL
jgi:hypothetical protein